MKRSLLVLLSFLVLFSCTKKKEAPQVKGEKPATKKVEAVKPKTMNDYLDITASRAGYAMKDGRKFFLTRAGEDIRQLFVTGKDGKHTKLTTFKDAVDGYSVSPGEKWIAFFISEGGNEQYDIYLMSTKDYSIVPALKDPKIKYDNVVWVDDDNFLYVTNEVNGKDFFIYNYDLKDKKGKLLVEKKGYNVITDAKSKDEFLFFTFLGNNRSTPYIYKNGKARKMKGAGNDKQYIPEGFLEDGVLMKTNEKSEFSYLEVWDGKGKKRPLFKDGRWSVENSIVDRGTRTSAVFCTNEDGYSTCYLYRNKEVKKLPLERGVHDLANLSGDTLVYRSNRPDRIPRPAMFDLKTSETTPFGMVGDNGIDVENFVSPELVKIKSFDGTEVPFFLYKPKNAKAPYKTLVYFHGGPASQIRPYFIASWQYYLKKGYMVVAPNVRGSGGYGQTYMDMDNYKKRMDSVKDGGAIMDYLVKKGLTKKNDFSVMGGSYGGFMVVASMATYPENVRCGIDNVGVVDFLNFLKNTKAYRRKLREVEYGPLSDPEFLKKISPTNMVDTISGRLLVAHGANDPRVPVSDAYILIDKMKKSGKYVESLIFDDEGHGFRKKKNLYTYYGRSAEFIDECYKK